MKKWVLILNLFLSALGVLLSVSACGVFLIYYKHLVAGTWATLSGVFAALSFHLHFLYWRHTISVYHSKVTLDQLAHLGFVVAVVSSAFCLWYIFAKVYWGAPMSFEKDSIISAVWSFMTAKWSVNIFIFSNKYSRIIST